MKKSKLKYVKSSAQSWVKLLVNACLAPKTAYSTSLITYLKYSGQDCFWIQSKPNHRPVSVAQTQILHGLLELSIARSHFIKPEMNSFSYLPKYFLPCSVYAVHQLYRTLLRIVCVFDIFIAIPNCYEFHIFLHYLFLCFLSPRFYFNLSSHE